MLVISQRPQSYGVTQWWFEWACLSQSPYWCPVLNIVHPSCFRLHTIIRHTNVGTVGTCQWVLPFSITHLICCVHSLMLLQGHPLLVSSDILAVLTHRNLQIHKSCPQNLNPKSLPYLLSVHKSHWSPPTLHDATTNLQQAAPCSLLTNPSLFLSDLSILLRYQLLACSDICSMASMKQAALLSLPVPPCANGWLSPKGTQYRYRSILPHRHSAGISPQL